MNQRLPKWENFFLLRGSYKDFKPQKIFLFLVLFFTSSMLFAQKTVTGNVSSKDSALQGVTVTLKGTTNSALTDAAGHFSITAPSDGTLIFTSVGFGSEEVKINNRSVVNIQLSGTSQQLGSVVVVGYGTQLKKDLTGSIVSLGANKIEERPVANFLDAINGQASGLQIWQGNAAPGQMSTVVIRGIASISTGYAPLYVIDGYITDQANANAINPTDIQSVEILKDASATAIYGSRGGNGVIIITTKSGKGSKPSVYLNLQAGFSDVNKQDFYPVLTGPQYVEYAKEIVANTGPSTPSNIGISSWDGHTSTDWQNQIYQKAPYQNYSVSLVGSSNTANYNLSMGYIDQGGIIKNTDYKKYSLRARVDFKLSDKFKIGLNIAPNYSQSKNMPDGDFTSPQGAATFMPPTIPIKLADGSYGNTQSPGYSGISAIQLANPLQIIDLYQGYTYSTFILSNAYLDWEIIKDLKFRTSIGANTSNIRTESYIPSTLPPLPQNPTGNYNNATILNWLNENTLNYTKIFGENTLELLGGFTYQHEDDDVAYLSANSFPTNDVSTLNGGSVMPNASGTSKSEWAIVSYLARANYNYKGKYLLTVTWRRDGSSRFGSNYKYGNFPSAAVGWNFSDESFMRDAKWMNSGKIRTSYGKTGNNEIGDFAAIGLLATTNQPFGLGSGSNNIGLTITTPPNPNLTWETANQFDAGIDLTMFNNRVNFTFDYYNRLTDGLLLDVNVPMTTGYSSSLQNIGKMRSTGFEFSLNYQVLNGAFKWNVGGNLSLIAEQKVLALGPDGSPLIGFYGTLITQVGGHLEEGRYLHSIGIISEADIQSGYPLFGGPGVGKPGDYKYEDVNKDGIIDNFNQKDGKVLGNNINRGVYGITTSFSYKNFDLNVLMQGQWGAYVYDLANQLGQLGINGLNTLSKFYNGRYISESQPGNGQVPRAGFYGAGTPNTAFLNPTAFFRFRNVNFGYNIPPGSLAKLQIKSLRAFISIDNLARITSFMGGNPGATRFVGPAGGAEVRLVGDGRSLGNNSAPSLPIPRTFAIGASVRF